MAEEVALAVWGNPPLAVMAVAAAGRQFSVLLAVSFMVMVVMVVAAVAVLLHVAAVVGMGIIAPVS